ncbi:MAG: J domain-containing protein [Gloeomargarita sp. SKYG116]|nr:J domain-containing protein [Gloeomargarita sp. SKYG116]MCS7226098.1 J domain-containing protein [Gloeomargarita sp. SKYB31]MDW8400791.1 J domain-containing protein [Gloeomargarita sp. SKYGB_i_bin116]
MLGISRPTYYEILGVPPFASGETIRRAYRELSKRYHPDTTTLPLAIAQEKFHEINRAYTVLICPEQRAAYDQLLRQHALSLVEPSHSRRWSYSYSSYLDPTDRPLSAGELFALCLLGLTFVGCLFLVVILGLVRSGTVSA